MAWFLKLEHHGRDLYPILRERFERPEYSVKEKVRWAYERTRRDCAA